MDVFWDTNTGNRLVDFMAVCLPVVEVRGVTYPDKRVTRRDPRTHQILEPLPEDYVSFDVVHEPVACMYPHCEIRPMKNGSPVKLSEGMNNRTREVFAEIANKYRSECVKC